MSIQDVKMVKFRYDSWTRLRRTFYGRKNENFSDYIERLAEWIKEQKK